jgi:hypothetical protein
MKTFLKRLIDTYHLDDIIKDFSEKAEYIVSTYNEVYYNCYGKAIIDPIYLTDCIQILVRNHEGCGSCLVNVTDDDQKRMILSYIASEIRAAGTKSLQSNGHLYQ